MGDLEAPKHKLDLIQEMVLILQLLMDRSFSENIVNIDKISNVDIPDKFVSKLTEEFKVDQNVMTHSLVSSTIRILLHFFL